MNTPARLIRIGDLLLCLIAAGCGVVEGTAAMFEQTPKEKSQLETRQMQTREFDTNDVPKVMKAMLNVLQDDGFIVKQVSIDMGFFNATKEVDKEDKLAKVWGTFRWGPHATWEETAVIDCTSNVSKYGEKTRGRANFQFKMMNNRGGISKAHTIDDPKYYQDFFAKVDKGIFLEKEKL